ncbi:MAG: nucleotide exchange factor GrpE [Vicingaceae bacterium]
MKEEDKVNPEKEEVMNSESVINQSDEEVQDEENKTEEQKQEEPEKDELTLANEKIEELNNKFLRLYSEFENFRRRTAKERIELFKTAGEEVIVSILPVLDDFERAMKADESNESDSFREGVLLIYQKLLNTLNQQGLKAIETSTGKDFDVNFHEAISQVPAPDNKMKGKVLDEVEKGYMLEDKVIRYTKVVIGA